MNATKNQANKTSRWDFFSYPESNRVHPHTLEPRLFVLDLPNGTTLEEGLVAYYAAGHPKGSHRAGVFQIQNSEGVFEHKDGNRIDLSTPRKAAKVTFKSWDDGDKKAAEKTADKNVLAFGGGVDSTALLAMHLNRDEAAKILGISRAKLDAELPVFEAVVFSDPGAEFQHTYKNIEQARELCEKAGLEFVTVRREGETITEWVTRLGIVPVMPGGSHVCSLKFKGEVMAKWASEMYGKADRVSWTVGIEHNEGARVARFKQKGKSSSVFPLVTLEIDREKAREILSALWPIEVMKSSCVFCPFMQDWEIKNLTKCSDEFEIALEVEDTFKKTSAVKHQKWLDAGKPMVSTGSRALPGMWSKDAWANGGRLFAKKVDGKQLSVREWASLAE